MPDRERVNNGLANCPRLPFDLCFGECLDCDCPYYGELGIKKLHHDALVLLKEQEAVKPEREHSGGGTTWWNVCGNCKTAINPNDKFCHECGRPVKWE